MYSDHEIFLRELVANAVDATQKMKALAASGDYKQELGDLQVRIELDEKEKTLKIIDEGIGMTEEEVDKYINQIAFSSAGEFLEKYKDQIGNIIGHFGLGFYSAFMVSKKVTIETLSWKEGAKAVKWSCDGSPEYTMEEIEKPERGTVITLYLDDDSAEYATKGRITDLLNKYCKFMPVPIVFGKEQEWKDGKYVDTDKDKIINSVEPLWTKAPSELKDEDYQNFYRTLFPMNEEPLFYIHLNVDYPFNLTGILYFPQAEGPRGRGAQQDFPLLQPDVRDGSRRQHRAGIHDPAARCHRLPGHPAEREPFLPPERCRREENLHIHHQKGGRPSGRHFQERA